ncbi:MAG: FecR domain-containing protein [Acidobacteriota bacterium]|nr:FecR domain-containing protein [Acidobacteriota bacterium]
MGTLFDRLEEGRPEGPEEAELHKIWEASALREARVPDTQDAWSDLAARLPKHEVPKRSPVFRFAWAGGLALAAIPVLVLLLSGDLFQPPQLHFKTQPGEQQSADLADGSTVVLNADTAYSLREGFGDAHRTSMLVGEAFFDVVTGDHPFIIETPLAEVRVVGTRFNVFARGDRVRVGVVEGIVEVSDQRQKMTLQAGQQIWWPPRQEQPETVTPDRFPPWRNHLIHCDRTPLAEVCAEIGRRFNVIIRVENPETGKLLVDGLLDASNPKSAVDALCLLVDKTYRQENGAFIIE